MDQEGMLQEMREIMKQLPLNRQRYLLELARASKKAERYLEEPTDLDSPDGEKEFD